MLDLERKVFAERFPTFVEPWARTTIRFCQQITSIGLSTCGKGGAKLAARLGIQTSRQTILRRIMGLPDVLTGSVLFLGIDDFSFRRGYCFGTILVDLESRRVVDRLPDREAETSAQWMRHHPDITVVSRDRGSEYAKAAMLGAPQATQCADRFHIVKNLTEATQLILARWEARNRSGKQKGRALSKFINETGHLSRRVASASEPAYVEKARLARRAGRHTRYQQVVELREQGMTAKEIARRLGLSDRTDASMVGGRDLPRSQKAAQKTESF